MPADAWRASGRGRICSPPMSGRQSVVIAARPRGRLSYRASLLVVVQARVVLTSGLIAVRSWITTQRTIRSVTAEIFDEVTAHAAQRTRAHLGAATPALGFLSTLERRPVRAADP